MDGRCVWCVGERNATVNEVADFSHTQSAVGVCLSCGVLLSSAS